MNREQLIEEKRAAIQELVDEQKRILKLFGRMAKYPAPKRPETAIKRAFKMVQLAVRARMLENQKDIIKSQMLPFPKGGRMIEHEGTEVIIPKCMTKLDLKTWDTDSPTDFSDLGK